MPKVFDWQRVADPGTVVRHALEALRAGRLVVFPTETTYALAASGLAPEAVCQVRAAAHVSDSAPLPLALRGAAEARDWVPDLSLLGQRLARRFWPGPLTLASDAGVALGLAGRLPEEVRRHVCPAGSLRLRSPAHEAVLEVLRHLAGPLIMMPSPATEAAQVVQTVGDNVDLVIDDGPSRYRQPATVVTVNGNDWNVLESGVVSPSMLQQQAACMVIFICTGNTCRSPMAEGLCKKRLAERLGCAIEELPARGFLVLSAGVAAMMGGSAAPEAGEAVGAYGVDLSDHRSQPLTPELAAQADYLIAMTRGHVWALTEQFPRLGTTPRLLDPRGDDVPDPIGQAQPVYEECGRQIWQHLDSLVAQLHP